MRLWLVAQAWAELLYTDLLMLAKFRDMRYVVTSTPTPPAPPNPAVVTAVIEAVRTACMLYVKSPLCLQRSAVTTRMLRRHGVAADLVIGCRQLPFAAHAWVEIAGMKVGEELDGVEYFRVLDRW